MCVKETLDRWKEQRGLKGFGREKVNIKEKKEAITVRAEYRK